MMARALIGGCLLAVSMLSPDGAAAQTAAPSQDQNANTGNDLFRPPTNLFQMMYDYKTAPGNGSAPGATRDVTTETLNLRMDHSLDLAPLWILALRADLPLHDQESRSRPAIPMAITSAASATPMSKPSSFAIWTSAGRLALAPA